MTDYNDRNYSYSWHQSHDQATIILMVPYETQEEDIVVVIERNYLVVGVQGKPPVVKGRLYNAVDTDNSVWQLESRAARLPARERTTSTTSTVSSQSSYAIVSDPEISSSFAASLEGIHMSDAEEAFSPSPALSSPSLSSMDEQMFQARRRPQSNAAASRSVSPGQVLSSIRSSYSSLDSVHYSHSGRLLTLHLEKEQSVIWPSLIVGPAPDTLSQPITDSLVFNTDYELEQKYNMDPTSLALLGLEYFDIRKDKEEAFEYFVRAWHQARNPSATMRLVSQYVPLQLSYDLAGAQEQVSHGTPAYYIQGLGGYSGLARLYLEAGLLYLEGTAFPLLASSYSSLSSIRVPLQTPQEEGGTEAWKRDREAALKYFERAHALDSDIEIPSLSQDTESSTRYSALDLEMPKMDVGAATPESDQSGGSRQTDPGPPVVRRRKKKTAISNASKAADLDEMDSTWYLYIPGLVGAGTALVVVGIVGALSLSTWSRRNQSS
jgi:thiamine pyrophosphokinase